jgi:hypothetical protein
MSEVTRLLDAIGQGEPHQARNWMPIAHEKLRKLATAQLAGEAER